MPRKWSGFKPHEKLTPGNIREHLESLGIDTVEFSKHVRLGMPPSVMQKFFRKLDGDTWTRTTFAAWTKLYQDALDDLHEANEEIEKTLDGGK